MVRLISYTRGHDDSPALRPCGILHVPLAETAPKKRRGTKAAILAVLRSAPKPLSAIEVAALVGVNSQLALVYLCQLAQWRLAVRIGTSPVRFLAAAGGPDHAA